MNTFRTMLKTEFKAVCPRYGHGHLWLCLPVVMAYASLAVFGEQCLPEGASIPSIVLGALIRYWPSGAGGVMGLPPLISGNTGRKDI